MGDFVLEGNSSFGWGNWRTRRASRACRLPCAVPKRVSRMMVLRSSGEEITDPEFWLKWFIDGMNRRGTRRAGAHHRRRAPAPRGSEIPTTDTAVVSGQRVRELET